MSIFFSELESQTLKPDSDTDMEAMLGEGGEGGSLRPPPCLRDGSAVHPVQSCILSDAAVTRLALAMPKQRTRPVWRQLYSPCTIPETVFSLSELYKQAGGSGACIVAVRTKRGDVLGAYLSDGIRKPQPGQFFYGTESSFLFSVGGSSQDAGSSDAGSSDTGVEAGTGGGDAFWHDGGVSREGEEAAGDATDTDVRVYSWTGDNFLFCFSSPSSISIGGGDGSVGLYLEDSLLHGSSGPTETFANPPLCPPQKKAAGAGWPLQADADRSEPVVADAETGSERFDIAQLEVWGVEPIRLSLKNAAAATASAVPMQRRGQASVNAQMSNLLFVGIQPRSHVHRLRVLAVAHLLDWLMLRSQAYLRHMPAAVGLCHPESCQATRAATLL